MNTEDRQDRIDDYLRGYRDDPDQFEQELTTNPHLREETEATRRALEAIHLAEDARLKERLRSLEAGLTAAPAATEPVRLSPRPRNRRWWSYAAAAALVLFVTGYFLLRPVPTDSALAALEGVAPFPNLGYVITKGSDEAEPARAAAYIAYESGDYPLAEARFNAAGDADPVDRFYLAQSLLAQAKYGAARDLFRELTTTRGFQLSQESAFYAAVARLGMGARAEATAALGEIAGNTAHPMREEAATLLAELD